VQLAAWKPSEPACFSFLAGGPSQTEPFSSSRVTWAGPGSCSRASLSSVPLTVGARCQLRLHPSVVKPDSGPKGNTPPGLAISGTSCVRVTHTYPIKVESCYCLRFFSSMHRMLALAVVSTELDLVARRRHEYRCREPLYRVKQAVGCLLVVAKLPRSGTVCSFFSFFC
jgi:hypothetical protein